MPWTLLTLPRYAQIMGLDPLHFEQGFSALRPAGRCNAIWFQYDWQDNDKLSRYTLANRIAEAERDLADQLGFWPAPVWIEDEIQPYPRPQRVDLYQVDGRNIRGRLKSTQLKWGYIITGGTRAETLLPHVRGADIDTDGDGFADTAVFTVTMTAATEPCEVKAYFKEWSAADAANDRTDPASLGADPLWEIPSTGYRQAGLLLTVYIPIWYLFKPQLQRAFNAAAINADLAASYVNNVVFYRVWTDPEDQCTFLWNSDGVCDSTYAAAYLSQDGAFGVRDWRNSIVIPEAATYDATTLTFSPDTCWAEARDPDQVEFNYYCGLRPERRHCCDELDDYWAMTIAMLATARLDMPLCSCSAVKHKVDNWQEDLALVGESRSYSIDPIVLTNPFGTRRGEVEAWKRLVKARGRQKGQAILA